MIKNVFKSLCVSICLVPFFIEAQIVGGEATYKTIISKSLNIDTAQGSFKEELIEANLITPDMRPKLTFNDKNALWNCNQPIKGSSLLIAAIAYCDCLLPYYYSLTEGKSLQYNSAGPFMEEYKYVIEQSLDLKWKVEKESKKIGDYSCYKATAVVLDSDGKSQPVEAWFCPEIPFGYGPRGFGGLPGLIMELRYDRSVIGLDTLKLTTNEIKIDMPNKGTRISFAEYHNISKAKFAKFLEEQKE